MSGRHVRRRSLTFVVVAALLGAAGLAIAGLAHRVGGGGDVVLDVTEARIAVPVTSAPATSPPVTAPEPTAPVEVMALAAELPSPFSALPEEAAPRARPVGVRIDGVDVARYPVRPIALQPDGQMEIPDETEIGWYRLGAAPGEPGATVLAAHVSWNRTAGPFARLGTVEPGATVEVSLDDGTTRRYVATERAVYGKLELPGDRLWRTTGAEELVLITCGGEYNPQVRRYSQNVVVYAVPVP